MRHRKSGKKLGRTWEHRKAMFRNMAKSLIVHERIRTTVPKAKELSKVVDKLVTLAIRNDLNARRQAYKVLENHKLVQRLFNEIGPKFSNAQGGYTRVVKFATPRVGDSAAMALIEFTYFESKVEEKAKPKGAAPAAEKPDAGVEETAAPEAGEASETPATSEEQAVEEKPAREESPASEEAIDDKSEETEPEEKTPEEVSEAETEKTDQPDDPETEKEKQ